MKIFAHDGMVINLETISSVEKRVHYDSVMKKQYYLQFEFIGKNSFISTSYFYEESIIDEWLEEIAETMRKVLDKSVILCYN